MVEGAPEGADPRTSVVIATRDRRAELLRTLERIAALPEQPHVIVVDNGSSDGTAQAVAATFPSVELVALARNIGAPARNIGVRVAETDFVAFADDDSWWAPGALRRAADLLEASPRLAVLQGRILVGPEERLDPACAAMAASPLPPEPGLPGPPLLGFVACGAVVRRDAFLGVGGFDALLFFLGEEELVAQDLAAQGWALAYAPDVVVHHHPSPARDAAGRRRRQTRNALLSTWMRRPLPVVARRTAQLVVAARRDRVACAALAEALRRLPAALRARRLLPPGVERQVALLDRQRAATA